MLEQTLAEARAPFAVDQSFDHRCCPTGIALLDRAHGALLSCSDVGGNSMHSRMRFTI